MYSKYSEGKLNEINLIQLEVVNQFPWAGHHSLLEASPPGVPNLATI